MKIYYVILVDGLPSQVTGDYGRALQHQRELSTRAKEAVIIPCTEVPQKEGIGDFSNEEPTDPDFGFAR